MILKVEIMPTLEMVIMVILPKPVIIIVEKELTVMVRILNVIMLLSRIRLIVITIIK